MGVRIAVIYLPTLLRGMNGINPIVLLHALGAPPITSQISVTFRRDTMVDVADPDVPSCVAAGEGGAAPPEVSEVPSPSGVLTRSQRECTDAAAAGDLTRLKRANENGCSPCDSWDP
jgi:hypothetical protein